MKICQIWSHFRWLHTGPMTPSVLCTYQGKCEIFAYVGRYLLNFLFPLFTLIVNTIVWAENTHRWMSGLQFYKIRLNCSTIWSNPILLNWRPAIQWYFPLSLNLGEWSNGIKTDNGTLMWKDTEKRDFNFRLGIHIILFIVMVMCFCMCKCITSYYQWSFQIKSFQSRPYWILSRYQSNFYIYTRSGLVLGLWPDFVAFWNFVRNLLNTLSSKYNIG